MRERPSTDPEESHDRAPLVSVVIPCHNTGRYLAESVQSAREQTYRPIEVIVVDDGSTDNSAAVAAGFPDVTLISQERQGVSAARNRGLEAARGAYIVFHDADDRLLPWAVETGVAALEQHPDVVFAYGSMRFIGRGQQWARESSREINDAGYARFLAGDAFYPPGCAIFRKDAVEAVGGFRVGMALAEDYEFYLRVSRKFPVVSHNKTVVEYRVHDANVAGRLAKARLLRVILDLLEAQAPLIAGDPVLEKAARRGRLEWKRTFSRGICREVLYRAAHGRLVSALGAAWTLAEYHPMGLRFLFSEPVYLAMRAVQEAMA